MIDAHVAIWGARGQEWLLSVDHICCTSTSALWLGSDEGFVHRLQWEDRAVETDTGQNDLLEVVAVACGHAAQIRTMLHVPSGAIGRDAAVLTFDATGRACLWQEPSGALLRAAQTQLQPVAGVALLLPGSRHAAVPCHLPGRSADGGAVSRIVEQQGLAVLDLQTLQVADVATPASLLSLQKFWDAGHTASCNPLQAEQPRLLAAKLLVTAAGDTVVVTVSDVGDVVTFLPEAAAGTPPPNACHEPASRLHHTISAAHELREAGREAQLLQGPLVAAAFAPDGRHLLLVAAAVWLLLHAPLWEVRGPPHQEYIVCSGTAADLRPSWKAFTGCCMLPSSAPGHCQWAVCGADGTVAVYSLRVNGSSCTPAPQPSANYTPAHGARITSARLLLSHAASQLLVLSGHSAAAATSLSASSSLQATKLSLAALHIPAALPTGDCRQLQPLHSCSLSFADTRHNAVTCQLLVGGDACAPSLLVQGWQSGAVSAEPLVGIAAGISSRLTLPGQHAEPVTCLMQHRWQAGELAEDLPEFVLISGAADGTINAWDMAPGDVGRRLVTVTAHSGAVTRLQAVPADAGAWRHCVLSTGTDGIVCLISLASGACERVLPGHPEDSDIQVAVDGRRGYLTCLCTRGEGEAVAMVWDLHSGVQDRALWGDAAHAHFAHAAASSGGTAAVSWSLIDAVPPEETCHLPAGVLVLSVAVRQLLTAKDGGGTGEMPGGVAAAAATALALLHPWSADTAVDSQLARLLTELQLLPPPLQLAGGRAEPPLPNELMGPLSGLRGQQQGLQAAQCGEAPCVLPALVSSGGVTLAAPTMQQPASAASEQHPSQQQEERQQQRQPPQQPGAVPAMLKHSPILVSQRLLAVAALSRRLIVSGQLSKAAIAACNSVMVLATAGLQQAAPQLAAPPLGFLLPFSQDTDEHVREAARALLRAHRSAAASDSLAGLPAEAAALLRLPEDSPGGVVTAAQLQQHAAELLVAAALCLEQPAAVPPQLLAITASGTLGLACAMPAPHAAEAATLLARALSGPAAASWRPHLGSLRSLTDRLFEVCARNGIGTARPPRRPSRWHSTDVSSPPVSPLGDPGGNPGSSPFARAMPPSPQPADSVSPSMHSAEHQQASAGVGTPAGGDGAAADEQQQQRQLQSPSCREAAAGLLPALALFDLPGFLLLLSQRLGSGGTSAISPTHVMSMLALLRLAHSPQGLQALAAQLPSVVATVLQALGELSLRKACLQGVTMVVQELCRTLPMVDYHNGALLLAVGTPPAPAAHAGAGTAAAAAVGGSHTINTAGGTTHSGLAATLYDMHSGAARLHLVTEGHATCGTGPGHGHASISALAFDAEGERVVALSVAAAAAVSSKRAGDTAAEHMSAVLRVWSLDLGFRQRLQQLRGPVPLDPTVCKTVSLPSSSGSAGPGSLEALDLEYLVKWEPSGRVIAVLHGGKVLTMQAC